MTEEPTFQPYPGVQKEPATHVLIVTSDFGGGGNSRHETAVHGPMPESKAIEVVDMIARGAIQGILDVKPDATIVQISPREVILFGDTFWTGGYRHHVQVGERRR